MNKKTPEPDKQFKEVAEFLKELNEKQEGAKRWKERRFFESFLQEKFKTAFGFTPDRMKLAYNLYRRLISSKLKPRKHLLDHTSFFHRGRNLVIVSQPYGIDEAELARWAAECGASYLIANEWGYYYPSHASLFFVEFTPQAKANLDRRVHL